MNSDLGQVKSYPKQSESSLLEYSDIIPKDWEVTTRTIINKATYVSIIITVFNLH